MKRVPMQTRHLLSLLLAIIAAPAAYAQSKTVTFSTGTTPNVLAITLVDGQPVTIGTTGNLSARCTGNPAGTQCAGVPTGGGGGANPATATLTGSLANGASAVPPGSAITLTPQSNGAVCLRRSTPATAWGPAGSFGNPILATVDAGDAQSVNLATGNQQYTFDLQCYGDGGGSAVQSWTVTTAAGGGGGPANCSAISPPPGFTRSALTSFTELRDANGLAASPFPQIGAPLYGLGLSKQQYVSIAFTVPTNMPSGLTQRFFWNTVNFVSGGYVNIFNSYVTLSECPGDFRIPPQSQSAPVDDPTFAEGCRSWRGGNPFTRIDYDYYTGTAQPATSTRCAFQVGRTYYFNVILDGPSDGVINQSGTSGGCQQPASNECGFGMRYD